MASHRIHLVQVLWLAILLLMVVNISESVSVKHATKPILARSDDITVTLPCDFTTATYETPQITWYQEKAGHRKEIMQYDIHNRLSSYGEFVNRVTRGDRGALVILRPSPRDSGNYSCEVEVDNETPSWVKTSVELLVEEEPLTTTMSTADSTERTPKQTEDVKGGLVFFIAILWMVPTVCSFILGKKGFHRCKETHRNLRTKTLRQIFTLVSGPVVVFVAFCLVLTGSLCTGVALSSTLLEVANYYRAAGLATGILGILVFLLAVLWLYLPPNLPCKKKAPIQESDSPDVLETGKDDGKKSAESERALPDVEANLPSSSLPSRDIDSKTLPEQTVPLLPQKPIQIEKPEPKVIKVENPSGNKVTGMVVRSHNEVYMTTYEAVFSMTVQTGMIQKQEEKLTECKYDILMTEKHKTGLLMLTQEVTSKIYKTRLLFMNLADKKYKFEKIDLDSKSRPTWVVTSRYDETWYLTMSNPARVLKKTSDKKLCREFGQSVLKKPACIVQNSSGRLIIADSRKNDLLVFEENGEFVTSMGISVPRNLSTEINGCDRLAIGPDDKIYATSPLSKNILVFSSDFRFDRTLPTRSEEGGAISCLLVYNDWLYVAHEDCIRVHRLKSRSSISDD